MCVLRPLVLCADDFGLTDGVSRGILHLARTGRISATSAMTNRPGWERCAGELRALDAPVGVGLHLTLTFGAPLGRAPTLAPDGRLPALGALLRRSLLGTLPGDEIREEIERQLAAFEAQFGRPPDFVDGHQHVHVLPGVRGPLLRALRDRGLEGRLWLRDPSDRLASIAGRGVARRKALLVRALASGFGEAARAAGFAANEGFSGFSPFDPALPAERVFAAALSRLGPRPLVMCHPGHADAELQAIDPVVATRPRELAYLTSDGFAALLERLGLVLAPAPG
jgi:chitin disaccharide deacetylase